MLQQVTLKGLRIPHSGFRIPYGQQSQQKHGGQSSDHVPPSSTPSSLVKTIATWKTVIESVQSLGMENYRVAFTRFLAFYADNPSGLCDGETPAKWQSKASFATHPSTETEWPPKLLTRFNS